MRVLAIDGGGIRGIVPTTVLVALEVRAGRPISELFDLVAGTSTGGIIACALAAPGPGGPRLRAQDVLALYHAAGPQVFAPGATADAELETALRAGLGETTLSQARTGLLVTAYDLEGERPWLFRSWRAEPDHALWQVARATAAAPGHFSPLRLHGAAGEPLALVDGGEAALDPTELALAEARERARVVVSLGTGATDPAAPAPGRHRFEVRLGPSGADAFDASEAERARLQALSDELVAARSADLDRVVAELVA